MNENTVGAKKLAAHIGTLEEENVKEFEKKGQIILTKGIGERNWNTVHINMDGTVIMEEGYSDIPGNEMQRQKFKRKVEDPKKAVRRYTRKGFC